MLKGVIMANNQINSDQPKVTISVLTYNRSQMLDELVASLCELRYSPLEIIVIDNHSQDETVHIMKKYLSKVNYIRNNENIGVAARNIALERAEGEIVITLDDDVAGITDDDINNVVNIFRASPTISAINFKVINPHNQEIINWIHHCKVEDYHDQVFDTYEITEGAVAFSKKALDEVGYYSPHYFISHEGPDLAFRLLEAGYDVIYTGSVTVHHFSAEGGRENWRRYYYDTRNQFWLAGRNFPITHSLVYLSRGLLSMLVYSVRDGYTKYWFKAVYDGIAGLKEVTKERVVLSKRTMSIIKKIDSMRPSLIYLIRKRLFQKSVNI